MWYLLAVVAALAIAAFIVLRRRKNASFIAENINSAVVITSPLNLEDPAYGTVSVKRLNGARVRSFFTNQTTTAIYMKPGLNKLELQSLDHNSPVPINTLTPVETQVVSAEANGRYTLRYSISDRRYIFAKSNNPTLFGKYWR